MGLLWVCYILGVSNRCVCSEVCMWWFVEKGDVCINDAFGCVSRTKSQTTSIQVYSMLAWSYQWRVDISLP